LLDNTYLAHFPQLKINDRLSGKRLKIFSSTLSHHSPKNLIFFKILLYSYQKADYNHLQKHIKKIYLR